MNYCVGHFYVDQDAVFFFILLKESFQRLNWHKNLPETVSLSQLVFYFIEK